MRRLVVLPVLMLLAACQPGSPQGDEPADAPAQHPGTPQLDAAVTPPAEPASFPLEVTPTGVGPITAETAFAVAAIQPMFPSTRVRDEFLHFGEETVPILSLGGGTPIVLEIQGGPDGRVTEVMISGGDAVGPGGERLMDPWPELGLTASDCEMGEGRFTGQPVCRKAGAENLAYVLAVPNWSRAELPDPTTLNGRARLAAFVWTRP